jgi:hypothetical protein
MFTIHLINPQITGEYSFCDQQAAEGINETTQEKDETIVSHPFDLDSYFYCLIKMQGYL